MCGRLIGERALGYNLSIQSFIHAESQTHQHIPDELKDQIHHCILYNGLGDSTVEARTVYMTCYITE